MGFETVTTEGICPAEGGAMMRRLLIANRGEIAGARLVPRLPREGGIESVAV